MLQALLTWASSHGSCWHQFFLLAVPLMADLKTEGEDQDICRARPGDRSRIAPRLLKLTKWESACSSVFAISRALEGLRRKPGLPHPEELVLFAVRCRVLVP